MTMGALIAAQAELWIDVPFVWQGRVRAGCDCKGLIAGVFAELGLPEADSLEALAGDYGDRVPVVRLRAGLAGLFDQVQDRQAGDILLCRMMGAAQHLAIAAPVPGLPWRAIEALPSGPARVRPATRTPVRVDSIWRYREGLS
jgi:hypothetical protein